MFKKSTLAQARLHELIPDGAHTYARGSDQYPDGMAPVLVRGRGARMGDLLNPDESRVLLYPTRGAETTAAHTDADIEQTIEAAALQVYSRAVEEGSTESFLVGRPVAPVREFAEPRRLRQPVATTMGGAS